MKNYRIVVFLICTAIIFPSQTEAQVKSDSPNRTTLEHVNASFAGMEFFEKIGISPLVGLPITGILKEWGVDYMINKSKPDVLDYISLTLPGMLAVLFKDRVVFNFSTAVGYNFGSESFKVGISIMEVWLAKNKVFLTSEFSYSSNNKHLFWGNTINLALHKNLAIGAGLDVTRAVFTTSSVSGKVEKDFKLVARYRF